MPRKILYVVLLCGLVLAGCSEEQPVAPTERVTGAAVSDRSEALAWSIVEKAGWPTEATEEDLATAGVTLAHGQHCPIHGFERVQLTDDIALYSMQIQVGEGPYDVMGLHRVVKERFPFWPIRAKKSVMFVHGSPGLFREIFLTGLYSTSVPSDHAMPIALAEDGVDVWGVDLRWTLVPEETQDFGFMADWNTDTDIADMRTALGAARLIRLITGNGWRKMHYLGYSYGGYIGYAYLNMETQMPRGHRHVRGFINVDYHFKTDCEDCRERACVYADFYQYWLDSGVYADSTGQWGRDLSRLARSAPEDSSSFYPGMTNYQAALAYGSSFEAEYGLLPGYHLTTGEFNDAGIPTSLVNVSDDFWLDFMELWSPWTPVRSMLELLQVACDSEDLPYDDHLGEIKVPVLYVGAGGGFGEYGLYTLSLLGSTDITSQVFDEQSAPEERLHALGHVDLFAGEQAPGWSWALIRSWVADH